MTELVSEDPVSLNLSKFLTSASPDAADSLFRNEASVLLLVARLDAKCKLVVSRLLPIREATRWEPMLMWFAGKQEVQAKTLKAAIARLRKLKILQLQQAPSPGGTARSDAGSNISGNTSSAAPGPPKMKYLLRPDFRTTLLASLFDE